MSSKIAGLKRLASLYGKVEQIRSLQVRAAAVAVAEVEQMKSAHQAAERHEAIAGRTALAFGDRVGWSAAAVQGAFAEAREQELDLVLNERELEREQAAMLHRVSHQRMEQMDGLVESAVNAESLVSERRTQAASDDRYLSRRAWLEARSAGNVDETAHRKR